MSFLCSIVRLVVSSSAVDFLGEVTYYVMSETVSSVQSRKQMLQVFFHWLFRIVSVWTIVEFSDVNPFTADPVKTLHFDILV